jgi:hypothetical protein
MQPLRSWPLRYPSTWTHVPPALGLDAVGLRRPSHGLACVEQILGRLGRKSNLPHGPLNPKRQLAETAAGVPLRGSSRQPNSLLDGVRLRPCSRPKPGPGFGSSLLLASLSWPHNNRITVYLFAWCRRAPWRYFSFNDTDIYPIFAATLETSPSSSPQAPESACGTAVRATKRPPAAGTKLDRPRKQTRRKPSSPPAQPGQPNILLPRTLPCLIS